jgi:hypothetical protein
MRLAMNDPDRMRGDMTRRLCHNGIGVVGVDGLSMRRITSGGHAVKQAS